METTTTGRVFKAASSAIIVRLEKSGEDEERFGIYSSLDAVRRGPIARLPLTEAEWDKLATCLAAGAPATLTCDQLTIRLISALVDVTEALN